MSDEPPLDLTVGEAATQAAFRWFPDGFPDPWLDLDDLAFLGRLGRPTLARIPGTGSQAPRAVATLLHGDESSGIQALLTVLRRRQRYPFDLYVLIGNVKAALADGGYRHRFLDGQEDFNRIWGLGDPTSQARRAADGMLGILRDAGLESLVDVHNNTGDNPFYAVVTRMRPDTVNLATLFTTTLLRWDFEAHTLMEELQDECAAIAVECGLPGRPESVAFALDGIRRYLGAPPLVRDRIARDHDILGGLRKVVVKPEVTFTFGTELDEDVDFVIAAGADVHNFVEVEAGHVLGWLHPGAALPLRATDEDGRDVTADHFTVRDGTVVTTATMTPVMMTRTIEAARKDCLFYISTELPPPTL